MTRLTKGLFGHEFRNTSNLFGLACGQMRADDIVHNGGWYNRAGEKLGWGDLSAEDLRRIARELRVGELFIILGESDSFWNFVTHNPGTIGACATTTPTAEAPGIDYVADKCYLIIGPGCICYVDRYGSSKDKKTIEFRRGFNCEVVSKEDARRLITS